MKLRSWSDSQTCGVLGILEANTTWQFKSDRTELHRERDPGKGSSEDPNKDLTRNSVLRTASLESMWPHGMLISRLGSMLLAVIKETQQFKTAKIILFNFVYNFLAFEFFPKNFFQRNFLQRNFFHHLDFRFLQTWPFISVRSKFSIFANLYDPCVVPVCGWGLCIEMRSVFGGLLRTLTGFSADIGCVSHPMWHTYPDDFSVRSAIICRTVAVNSPKCTRMTNSMILHCTLHSTYFTVPNAFESMIMFSRDLEQSGTVAGLVTLSN